MLHIFASQLNNLDSLSKGCLHKRISSSNKYKCCMLGGTAIFYSVLSYRYILLPSIILLLLPKLKATDNILYGATLTDIHMYIMRFKATDYVL